MKRPKLFQFKKRRVKKVPKKILLPLDDEITFRVRILSGVIIFAFLVIFIRLIYIQVVSYDDYTAKKDDYTSIRQYVSAPRGQIYDCNGNILAKTVVSHNIVYTSPQDMTTDDYILYAERIVTVFDVDTDDFTDTDKKEAYITYKTIYRDSDDDDYLCNDLLTKKELKEYNDGTWGSDAETIRHNLIYARITNKMIKEMSDTELKTCVVYQRMIANASTGQENVVLEDVSDNDVAYLVEHKTDFPGFDADFGGWKREYPYGETLSDVIGSVSTSTEGLPEEYADYYLQRGYQYNAPVGKSGLELQYNDVLSGTSQISKITYDSQGLAKQEIVREAVKGNDVYLTIDIDLQQKLDEQVKTVLETNAGTTNRENFSSLFMIMMNPNDGSVLALSGYQIDLDSGEMTYFASGCYKSLANPGSSVKGATVYMGESEGVVEPGEVIIDQTMLIGNQEFSSFTDHGAVDDIGALAVSSNVYMFNIAIRLGGDEYSYGKSLNISDVTGTLDKMRSYFSMFGLGNKTGLDVPDEVDGYMGAGLEAGIILNYAIGQFDMYTPVQLLQYVSTIANDGYMYRPSLMKYIKEVNSDQIISSGTGFLQSALPEENSEYLERVQQGFRQVVVQGDASDDLMNMEQAVAGKTGTAEVEDWTTAVFVGYAPYEDPQVSFACVAPTSSVNSKSVAESICTYDVIPDVLEYYFELYPVESQ